MPARLLLLSDDQSTREEFWIEAEVSRVGSDPACHVQIADLPQHALTLQLRDDGCVVINRTPGPLDLDRAPLASGESAPWQPGTFLRLPGGLTLGLEMVAGDQVPSYRAEQHHSYYDELVDDETIGGTEESPEPISASAAQIADVSASDTAVKSVKNAVQLAIIIVCFAGAAALLLFGDSLKSKEPAEKELPPLSQIVEGLLELEAAHATGSDIRTSLQEARKFEVLERKEEAKSAYVRAREALLQRANTADPPTFATPREKDALQYILVHLQRLERP